MNRPHFLQRILIRRTLLSLCATSGMLLALGSVATSATTPISSPLAPGAGNIHITADKQSYKLDQKRYFLNGHVNVVYQDMHITGPEAQVEMDAAGKPQVAHFVHRPMFRRIKPQGGVDTVVGDIINVYLGDDRYAAQGSVESHITTVAADPFFIRSDIQEFDNKNKVVSASGSVKVDYQGSKAFSPLANVRMKDNGKADRVIFSGGARIEQETSEINGEKITVMVDSGNLIAERNVHTRVDLKEKTQPTDPDKVFITSDYQQYDKASDTMIASGNVKILYGDYVAVGPKATFKMHDKELDHIFLTGRPTITQNGRVITADKITITTNPKNFDAIGNVKVNFKTGDKGPVAAGGTTPAKASPASAAPKTGPNGKVLPKDDPSDY